MTADVTLFLVGTSLVSLVSGTVLSYFAEKNVAWSSFLASVLGFTLSLSIVGLIPYDVWASLMLMEHAEKKAHFRRECWSAIYWTTTVLCYLVIPFLIEFEAAGEFTFAARAKKSLRNNIVWYSAYLAIGICAVTWTFVNGMDLRSLSAWCIAASNAWGLILLTILMGFGLVALPRHLWNLADPSGQLRVLYPLAIVRDGERKSAQYELQEAIAQARRQAEVREPDFEKEGVGLRCAYAALQETVEKCQVLQRELSGKPCKEICAEPSDATCNEQSAKPRIVDFCNISCDLGTRPSDPVPLQNRLVKLHVSLRNTGLEARRAACRFENLVTQCLLFEELEDGRFHSAVELLGDTQEDGLVAICQRALCRCHAVRMCWRQAQSLWVKRLRNRVLCTASYACGLLSALIVLGQLTMLSHRFNLSVLSMFFLSDHGAVFTQILCAMPLGYMACTVYWSVFRLKIAGWYGLYTDHNTDAGSLLWCAYSLARLALPLCYHFLLLVDVPPHIRTSFQEFMGQMVLVPILGHQMNQIFPCLVAVVVLCNVTRIYTRVVMVLGLSALEFDWTPSLDGGDDPIAEGKELIDRERRRRAEEGALELNMCDGHNGLAGVMPLRRCSLRRNL